MSERMTRSKSNGVQIISTFAKQNQTLFEYPVEGEPDRDRGSITFTVHDEKRLTSNSYLNDTIISFFMQYHLDHYVPHEIKERIHVFSSFFFAKIKSIKTQKSSGKNSFKCASRWLKGVKIFEKDYLIMPVCERDHWILVIVCNPSKTPSVQQNLIPDDDLHEPAVIVLNSSHGYAPSVKKTLNQFFSYQWQIERGNERNFSIQQAKYSGIRLLFPTLPQQRNSYNCGVFILNYFYCFLSDPRRSYLRMFRQRDMTKWFDENRINIRFQRRRMLEVIRSQVMLWSKSASRARRVAQESQEVLSSSPGSETSSADMEMNVETNSGNMVIVIP